MGRKQLLSSPLTCSSSWAIGWVGKVGGGWEYKDKEPLAPPSPMKLCRLVPDNWRVLSSPVSPLSSECRTAFGNQFSAAQSTQSSSKWFHEKRYKSSPLQDFDFYYIESSWFSTKSRQVYASSDRLMKAGVSACLAEGKFPTPPWLGRGSMTDGVPESEC